MAVGQCHWLGSPFSRGSFTGDSVVASQRFPVWERYIFAYREWRKFPPIASCVLVPGAAVGADPVWLTAQVSVDDCASGAGLAAGIPLVGLNDLSVVPAGLVPHLVQQAGSAGVGQRLGWLSWATTGRTEPFSGVSGYSGIWLPTLVRGCGAVWGCVQRETGFRTWGSCLVRAGHGCAARCRLDQSVRSGHDLAAFRGVFELHQDAGFEAGPFPPGGVILAPGIGSQGGDLRAAVLASVDERGRRAIIRASRAVSDCLKGPSWAASTLRADISAVLTDLGFPLA